MKKLLIISFILIICITTYSQFPRDQKIITAEYFINSDPGEGKGIVINTGSTPLWEVTTNISNISLPTGSKLYVRFKSTNGKWSAPKSILKKSYFENTGGIIQYGEYFINTDPGQGMGQQVNFQNDEVNINSLNLKRGDKVFFRIKDNLNRWSPARPVTFNFKEIDYAGYYIKHQAGTHTDTLTMDLNTYNPFSCVYIANANNIVPNNLDTVYIWFQTKDKFYSRWLKKSLTDITGIEEILPNVFHFSNFPNPFTDQTKICFELPEKSFVRLKIFGLFGNEVQILAEEQMFEGKHEIQFDRSDLPVGIYFCQLQTDHGRTSIKLIIQE